MTLIQAGVIALIAVVCFLVLYPRVKTDKKGKVILTLCLIAVLSITAVMSAATLMLVYREDDEESQIRSIARARVEQRIEETLEIMDRIPVDETSMKSFAFDHVKAEGRESLNEDQKKFYDDLLQKHKQLLPFEYLQKEVGYSGLDDLLSAAYALGIDYPLTESYCQLTEELDGSVTTGIRSLYFLPQDSSMQELSGQEMELLKQELEIFDAQCDMIVEAIPRDRSVYDQYRFLAIYLSLGTVYDYEEIGGLMVSTPYGAIEGGLAICQGYSKAYEYLCEKADLWCRCVSGVSSGVGHMWNLIRLEDGTYHVDITWSDDGNEPDSAGWYQYFAIPQDVILQYDHEITDGTQATGVRMIFPDALDY